MTETNQFTLELEHLSSYEFKVKFDKAELGELRVDEPPPLGELAGPNPSRLLAAAAANCLSASLLFCLCRDQVPDQAVKTRVTCRIDRNEAGRLRVGHLDVSLQLAESLKENKKLGRCAELFEDFCVVTASIRQGIPVDVEVLAADGAVLHSTKAGPGEAT